MALTPNYGFELPTEGSDDDTWGGTLNSNWSSNDTILAAIEARVADAEAAIENLKIKIGDLYLSTDAADPATKLGYGTWEAHGAGRALVGVGNNGTTDWLVNDERGAETHTLQGTEIPPHSHNSGTLATDVQGNHQHTSSTGSPFLVNRASGVHLTVNFTGNNPQYFDDGATNVAGAHGHNISGSTGNSGGGGAHNNIQPSIAVYVWKRTA